MSRFMLLAVETARQGILSNYGGPFGAVIVQDEQVVSRAHNEVLGSNDPTAHAEIVAIRRAAERLERYDLSDCTLYSTCEPCPMCLAAIHWAGIRNLVIGADRNDAAGGGFDDDFLYRMIQGQAESPLLHPRRMETESCRKLFDEWNAKADRVVY